MCLMDGMWRFVSPGTQGLEKIVTHKVLHALCGGVCVIYRSWLQVELVEEWSSPECLVLKLGPMYILCIYLPPENSEFARPVSGRPDPESWFYHISKLVTERGDALLVLGDLNARTASLNSFPGWPRVSQDEKPVSPRGRRLIRHLRQIDAFILNGCILPRIGAQTHHGGDKTSWQPNGESVVDYAIVNAMVVDSITALAISPKCRLSDHCALRLNLVFSESNEITWANELAMTDSGDLQGNASATSVHQRVPNQSLNATLIHVLTEVPRSADEELILSYGPASSCNCSPPLSIWLAAHATPRNAAGLGMYCPQSGGILYARVEGRQTWDRAVAWALLIIVKSVPKDRCLTIHSSAQSTIRTLSISAFKNCQSHWSTVANGELLCQVASLICERTGHIRFRTGHKLVRNDFLRAAEDLAVLGSGVSECSLEAARWVLDSTVAYGAPSGLGPAIHPNDRPSLKVRVSGLVNSDHESRVGQSTSPRAHRQRSSVRAIRETNTEALLNAPSEVQFWRTVRRISDPKASDPPFSARDLRKVFWSRLNVSSRDPSFSDRALDAAEAFARELPCLQR